MQADYSILFLNIRLIEAYLIVIGKRDVNFENIVFPGQVSHEVAFTMVDSQNVASCADGYCAYARHGDSSGPAIGGKNLYLENK